MTIKELFINGVLIILPTHKNYCTTTIIHEAWKKAWRNNTFLEKIQVIDEQNKHIDIIINDKIHHKCIRIDSFYI